jgi:hypothetical protein
MLFQFSTYVQFHNFVYIKSLISSCDSVRNNQETLISELNALNVDDIDDMETSCMAKRQGTTLQLKHCYKVLGLRYRPTHRHKMRIQSTRETGSRYHIIHAQERLSKRRASSQRRNLSLRNTRHKRVRSFSRARSHGKKP